MKVRFSYDAFRLQAHGGVSRAAAELHHGLLARGIDSRVLAPLHRNRYLDGEPGTFGIDVDWMRPVPLRQALTKGTDRAFERLWSPAQGRDVVYHKTYFDRHVPTGPTLAVSVYDMIHERYPEQVSRRDVTVGSKQAWCEAANVVFTISSRTRDDVLERFRLDEERVVVTPLGVRAVEPDRSAVPAGNPPFVLYVGQRQPEYKNFDALVRALARSESRHHTRLVCFGGGPLSDAERCLLQEHGLGDVVVAGGTDAALAAHYSSARALVYPSCYEGFGLPPLEAMMQGCPVVASTGGAIPEVVGDAAELFEPTDDAAMADAIDRVVLDDARRADLARLGHDRAASFTWDRTVDLTLAGYRQAQA